MKGQSEYRFSQVPVATIPRSVFRRSHQYKTTFNQGTLIPFYVDEVLPGDTFKTRLSLFCRLATPVVAIMDNIYLDVHFFFVPCRLLWSNWQKFCGEQVNPGDSTSYIVPKVTVTPALGTLSDYFGLPFKAMTVNVLPFRAYNLIYNEWYRDENLVPSAAKNMGDGPDSASDYVLRRRGKRHDYFTSCMPWPQKGPGVMLPLGTSATVKAADSDLITSGNQGVLRFRQSSLSALPTASRALAVDSSHQLVNLPQWGTPTMTGAEPLFPANLYADLSTATAATINSLRQAFQVQHLLERDARGGTRYVEILKSHFGVSSPDFRLQRPEYLGGGSAAVNVNPVVQNAPTTGTSTPLGTVSAFGVAARSGIGFTKSFVEHGYVVGILSSRADMTYQQGINKMWHRQTRYDFYWPALAHIGEQAVLNKELYYTYDNPTQDEAVFGYQERWAEYRYKPSAVTGLFRSAASGTLDFWHLAQNFAALPTLNQTFIEENVPMNRIKAVSTAPDFLFDSYFDVQVARPMPLYSVPGLIDHF